MHLLLDLIFQLGHVKHELVDFAGPHGELLSLEVLPKDLLPSGDSLLTPGVGHSSPLSEEPGKRVSVDGISRVGSNSLLLLLSLVVGLPHAHASAVVSQSLLHVEEPLDATIFLFLQFFKGKNLRFLFFDCLNELIDVRLLFIAVDLIIVLVL